MIHVLVAHETPLFRGALAALLHGEQDIEVVAEVAGWDELELAVPSARPHVIVLDVESAQPNLAARAARLCGRVPGTRALMLLEAGHHDVLTGAADGDLAALGFVTKQASANHLLSAVRSLANGSSVIDPQLIAASLRPPDNPLTQRERDILTLAAEGKPAKEIAARLSLSAGTVRNCLSRINTKVGASNRTEAIHRARLAGWL